MEVLLPEHALDGASEAELGLELRRLWVIEQVRRHRVGVGRGAELAGMPRAAFMQLLGSHGVPVIDTPLDDLREELRSIRPPEP